MDTSPVLTMQYTEQSKLPEGIAATPPNIVIVSDDQQNYLSERKPTEYRMDVDCDAESAFPKIDVPFNRIKNIDIRPIEDAMGRTQPTMKRPVFIDASNVAHE